MKTDQHLLMTNAGFQSLGLLSGKMDDADRAVISVAHEALQRMSARSWASARALLAARLSMLSRRG